MHPVSVRNDTNEFTAESDSNGIVVFILPADKEYNASIMGCEKNFSKIINLRVCICDHAILHCEL